MKSYALPSIYRAEVLKGLEDVEHDGSRISFGSSWSAEDAEQAMKLLDASLKQIQVQTVSKAYTPTESDYSAIQQMMLTQGGREYDVKKFGIYETVACDTLVDFTREKFTKRVLDAVQPQAADGITILVNHQENNMIGRTFAARVQPIPNDPANFELIVRFYVPDFATMPNGTNAVDNINTRVANFTSVAIQNRNIIWEETDAGYIRVYDYDADRPPVYVEHSVVYRGAQPRAAIKAFGGALPNENVNPNPIAMDITKTLKVGTGDAAKSYTVNISGTDKNPEVKGLEIIEATMNDMAAENKSLKDENAKLTEQAKAGKKSLVDSIRTIEKKLKQPETDEKALYALSHEQLEAKAKGLRELDAKLNPKDQTPKGEGGGNGDGTTEKAWWDDSEDDPKT